MRADAMLSNDRLAELKRLDTANHLPPQTDYAELQAMGGNRVITAADGCYIYDSSGRPILDGMAGLWCVNVGYGRESIADAVYSQIKRLPFYNTFFRTATEPTIELAAKIASLLDPTLGHVFFCGSGSEAADSALRLVRHYWSLRGQPERRHIISRVNAYHGSTVAGASLGGMAKMHAQGSLPIPDIHHVPQPYWFKDGQSMDPGEFGIHCAAALETKILEIGADRVAAFFAEPIQGAGGVIVPPASYWPEVKRILDRHGILLVADEVICGFGRLGTWFGHQHFGLSPDVVMMAKGLSSGYQPIGAIALSDEIFSTIKEGGQFAHGFTYSGHPVAAAAALANLEIYGRENLIENVRDVAAPRFARMVGDFKSHALVQEVRCSGLLAAFELGLPMPAAELPAGTLGRLVRDQCFDLGLVVRAIGDVIALCPPFTISESETQLMAELLREALDRVTASVVRDGAP